MTITAPSPSTGSLPARSAVPESSSSCDSPRRIFFLGALGLVLVLIRQGPLSLVLVLVAAFGLCAIPEFRQVVDSTIGSAPSAQQRLQKLFPENVHSATAHSKQPDSPSSKILDADHPAATVDAKNQPLEQLPKQLEDAFGGVLDLLLRDFVASWYNAPAVSTGDPAFLEEVRHALDHILAHAYSRISAKSTKETMVYLIGCLSMNLVRELNERSKEMSFEAQWTQRTQQTKKISHELLLTLGPPAVTLSLLPLTLMSEILTVQIVSIANSFDEDWFNTMVIQALGSSQLPSQETAQEVKQSLEVLGQPSPPNDSSSDFSGELQLQPGVDTANSLTGDDIISFYLKTLSNVTASSPQSELNTLPDLLRNLFAITPPWDPQLQLSQLELDDLISTSSPANFTTTSPEAGPSNHLDLQNLCKIWNQLESFRKNSHPVEWASHPAKTDAISLLSALSIFMNKTMDGLVEREQNPAKKAELSVGWKSVAVETLRRLEAKSMAPSLVFSNLQDWIVDLLYHSRNLQGQEASHPMQKLLSLSPRELPSTEEPARTNQGGTILCMAIPHVPSSQPIQQAHSYDLGDPHSRSANGASSRHCSDSISHSRQRASSFTRTAVSPPSSDSGVSPRHPHRLYESQGYGTPHARNSIHGSSNLSKLAYEATQEGDMTEGYSFEESSDHGDVGTSPLEQKPERTSSSPSSNDLRQPDLCRSAREGSHSSVNPPSSINTSLSNSSSTVFQPNFSVSVTDISPKSAFDLKTGLIKQKKDVEILIAIEGHLVSGFIVTRKWTEFEKMDSEINKLKLVGIGTQAFPRALLPSHLNFKTIDHLLRELEAYLENLLSNEKYSQSEPVRKFFAKERLGSSGSSGPINSLFNSTQSTLDSIGKGVANVGKEVVTKPVDLAAQGFNRFSKNVFGGLPFSSPGVSNKESSQEVSKRQFSEGDVRGDGHGKSKSIIRARVSLSGGRSFCPSEAGDETIETLKEPGPQTEKEVSEAVNPVHADVSLPVVSERDEERSCSAVDDREVVPQSSHRNVRSLTIAEQVAHPVTSSLGSRPSLDIVPSSSSDLNLSQVSPLQRPTQCSTSVVKSQAEPVTLDEQDFDAVILGMMSVLEAAYGLDSRGSNASSWSMRRGVLRILETVLRTTSWNGVIRKMLGDGLRRVGDVESIAEWIESYKASLWPGGVWWSSSSLSDVTDQKHSQDNIPLQQDKLRTTKGEKPFDDKEDKLEKGKKKNPLQEEARKLFMGSWASLKIGLGSQATELAAERVFEVFQKGGCARIVHSLILDVIRILLLL